MRPAGTILIGIAALGLFCPVSRATTVSDIAVVVQCAEQVWKSSDHPGSLRVIPNGDGTYSLRLQGGTPGLWNVLGFLSVDPDPFINGLFTATNLSNSTMIFQVTVKLPTIVVPAPALMSGSISGSILDGDGNGATMSAPQGGAVYTALIDNANVRMLMHDQFSVSTGGMATNAFGPESFTNEIAPGVNQTIGIQHEFLLTAHDSITVSSSFVVATPEPTTLALATFAFAAILVRRRKAR